MNHRIKPSRFQPQHALVLPRFLEKLASTDQKGHIMQKTVEFLHKIGLIRAKSASTEGESAFEKRMKKIDRARQMANARGMIFKNRSEPSKA